MSVTETVQRAASVARSKWAPEVTADSNNPVERAGQVGTVITVVVVGVVGLIGILIFDQVRSSIPTDALTADDGTNNQFGDSTDAIVSGFADSMELLPIVLLVLSRLWSSESCNGCGCHNRERPTLKE
jgi:hypothetical protein